MSTPEHEPTDPSATRGLKVWPAKEGDGYWNPDLGNVTLPTGWVFVPAGNAFRTRGVKQRGPHWVLLKRRKRYTETLGILCPGKILDEVEEREGETRAAREKARERAENQRQRDEERYRQGFEEASLRYLDFAPRYTSVARTIAHETAAHATVKRSGRVGRTSLLPLDEKVRLAVRAHLRHRYTSYEKEMGRRGFALDHEVARPIRWDAERAVDEFLRSRRRAQSTLRG
jgi:hypothetical protein